MQVTYDSSRFQQRERLVVVSFIVCVMLAIARVVRQHWIELIQAAAQQPHSTNSNVLYAPEAYRVGMMFVLKSVGRWFPRLSYPNASGISDFIFGCACLLLLYAVTVYGYSLLPEKRAERIALVGFTLAVMHFPLLWTTDWLRNITFPCAFYLCASLWLLLKMQERRSWFAVLVVLTVWQGLVRADIAFAFGLAVLLLAASGWLAELGPRWLLVGTGAAILVLSGGIQAYLQFVVFPHLTYPPDTPLWMWRHNLTSPYFNPFLVAMLPVALVYAGAFSQRRKLHAIHRLCLAAPLVYLPLWFLAGSLMEIRVFMPFYLILVPAAAHIVVLFLMSNPNETPAMMSA